MLRSTLLSIATVLFASQASAAVMKFDVTFTASNFSNTVNSVAPLFSEPFTGSFTIEHDFSIDANNQTVGLANFTSSEPVLTPAFDYIVASNILIVGGFIPTVDNVSNFAGGIDDFLL
ncbi:MAG: hypothetical protein AAGF76_12865 [Pseudomonadota bacterium]